MSRETAGLPCVTVATGPSLPHPSSTAVVFKAQGCRSRPRDKHNILNAAFVSVQVDRKVCLLAEHLDTDAGNPILLKSTAAILNEESLCHDHSGGGGGTIKVR